MTHSMCLSWESSPSSSHTSQRAASASRSLASAMLPHSGGRPMNELLAEIATVNDASAHEIRLMQPLMPGEARDLQENIRAQNRLRGCETMVHAIIIQILLDWCATASGQTRSEVLWRLPLRLDASLGEPGPPPERPNWHARLMDVADRNTVRNGPRKAPRPGIDLGLRMGRTPRLTAPGRPSPRARPGGRSP